MDLGDVLRQLSQTWPARAAQSAWQGLTLPGDVYQGNVPMVGPDGSTNPHVIDRAADLGSVLTLGAGAAPAEANALRAGAGKPLRLQSDVMDQFKSGAKAASDEALDAILAERQAGMQAAMAARRASGNQPAEIDMSARRPRKPAAAPSGGPNATRLESEVMRLFRERQNEL